MIKNAVYRSSTSRPSSTLCSDAKYQPLKFEHAQKAKFRNYNLSLSLFHLFRFSRPLVFLSLDIYYASFRWEKFLEKLLES